MSDEITPILGPACLHCGWRSGQHRPAIAIGERAWPACPDWTPAAPATDPAPDTGADPAA